MQALKTIFMELSNRERLLISLLMLIVLAVVLWAFIYRPLLGARQSAIQAYAAASRDAAEVAAAVELRARFTVQTDEARTVPPFDEAAIRSIVSETSKAMGLTLSRLQPDTASGGITVWFDAADAKLILEWVRLIYEDHGVSTDRASIQRGKDATVRAQFLLVPAAG